MKKYINSTDLIFNRIYRPLTNLFYPQSFMNRGATSLVHTKTYSSNRSKKPFHIYFSDDIQQNLDPVFFKTQMILRYKEGLHKVLKNDKIVSCLFQVKFINNEFRTLGIRFGFKFNYDEMINWDYTKSPYYPLIKEYLLNDQLNDSPPKLFLESFDYKFTDHCAPLNLDQHYTRWCGTLLDLCEIYEELEVEFFSIVFWNLSSNVDHRVRSKPQIPLKDTLSNIKQFRKEFKHKNLPLTLDENAYGRRSYSTRTYIDDKNNIKRVVTDLSTNKTKKEIFAMKSGVLLDSFIDEKINNNTFIRHNSTKKSSVTVTDNEIVRVNRTIKLDLIRKPPLPKKQENSFNKRIGSFDMETYLNTKTGLNEVYAVGYAYAGVNIIISVPEIKTYYLEREKSSSDIVIECINQMLQTKYNLSTFYTHNLAGFDIVFLLKILAEYNEKVGYDYYKLEPFLRDDRIIKMKISAKISSSVKNSISLVDSLCLLPTSLSSLAASFSTKYLKPIFPYSFVNDKTLFYKGNTPAIEYFHTGEKNMSLDQYNNLWKKDWDLKKETLQYLESDLISLLEIMYEFNGKIFDSHNVEVTKCLTITGLALKIFLKNHYSPSLPLITKKSMYRDIKEGYYGGLSEVYKGYGENLYYYDVNSLYPYCALNDMVGNVCEWIEAPNDKHKLDISKDGLFGFFYCDVKTNKNDYIGLLPVRKLGVLTYPLGEFSGWWFSPLIEYAMSQGYEIKIHKGYTFNRVPNVFNSFVELFYREKKNSVGAYRLISKFLLNSLLGRFGMIIDKRVTSLVNRTRYEELITTHAVYSEKKITDNLNLVTHGKSILKSVCEQHGIKYIDAINEKAELGPIESRQLDNISVAVSAAVNAYSAIFMLKVKKHILALGGEIYYTDTDSIVTNIKLDQYEGVELGKFKLEYKILRGYFISSKLYCLIIWDEENKKEKTIICDESEENKKEKTIIKAKGVLKTKLSEEDFKKMLQGESITHAVKKDSKRNYEKGTVSIGVKEGIHLNPSSYRKRIKVLDPNTKKWIDTKALLLNFNENNNSD